MKQDSIRSFIRSALLALAACSTESTAPPIPVASVLVGGTQDTVLVGATLQLSATVQDAAGNALTGRAVTWESSNEAVAKVSADGLVTGVSVGDVTITATSEGVRGTAPVGVRLPLSPPSSAPTNVTAAPGPVFNAITIEWQPVIGATAYLVYWGNTPDLTPQNGATIFARAGTVEHDGLTPNTTYYYLVTAINPAGEGPPSAIVHATASSDIALAADQPAAGALTGNQLHVVIQATSRFQLASVVANVSGHSANLVPIADTVFSTGRRGPAWVGTIALVGLPRGPLTLGLLATDVFSNIAQGSVGFVYDQPPQLTITAPVNFTVARPDLHIAVTCQDDDPKGCVSLQIFVEPSDQIATAPTSFDQTVSLANYDGRAVVLEFVGTDSAGQRTTQLREVFIESSPQLTEVATMNGYILDVQPDRIFFLDESTGGNALTIHDRVSGTDAVILNPPQVPTAAVLTPVGAMIVSSGNLYDWENGVLSNFGQLNSDLSLRVNGGFALWSMGSTLTQRDFSAGQNIVVSTNAGNINNDVAANGDVAYWSNTLQVVRFRSGVSTQLTNDATLWNTYPVTDGVNVVYRKSTPCCANQVFQIAVYDASGEHLLTPADVYEPQPGNDYQATNGWVAYRKSDAVGSRQVWSRSPTGQDMQVTKFGGSSGLEFLGPNGEVTFFNGRRYLAVPDYTSSPRDIGSGLGKVFFQNGGIFVAIGRSLFQVNP